MEAMQAQAVDVIKRMKEIALVMKTPEHVLEAQGVTTADLEGNAMNIQFTILPCTNIQSFIDLLDL